MTLIKGIPIQLAVKQQTGTDDFEAPIYEETYVTVDNVLVGEPTTDEIVSTQSLFGKRLAYVLGIPKGDDHNWTDTTVIIWGMKFRTIGIPTQGIEEMIPLSWNKKVKVERYEQQD